MLRFLAAKVDLVCGLETKIMLTVNPRKVWFTGKIASAGPSQYPVDRSFFGRFARGANIYRWIDNATIHVDARSRSGRAVMGVRYGHGVSKRSLRMVVDQGLEQTIEFRFAFGVHWVCETKSCRG
ncbi:hypothetical protein P171DRAFT_433492 [Karstenula rhodostoma CBS 690.94]|uniref:Uncharacterized protein n=1 Tax=Karstenula rhodostoma CBS 690.94 TaxID=1392251 RepID=A0A9P4PDS6_9PLEO|nr:hypothetical protein P171DRAFT_433492 [Karstenula rhodostoma CBS 690.94]